MAACELPATYNLKAYRGDSWSQLFRFLTAPNAPLDLTGASVAAWARNDDGYQPLDTIIEATAGEVTIAMPDPQLDPSTYSYDIEVTEAGGTVTTWVRGRLTVEEDVTYGH